MEGFWRLIGGLDGGLDKGWEEEEGSISCTIAFSVGALLLILSETGIPADSGFTFSKVF